MSLRPVINATGIVLHTNLGRARLSDAAVEAIHSVAQDYNTLEYNLEKGSRGSRYSHVEKLIAKLTGTEAAMVVNNNAAAVMLVLSTMTKGKEVITSRGELVEIGGAFRVPEIMQQSGGTLVEVGTTNKTHLSDYQNAITENTGALLKVHTSNFKIMGFCEEVSLEEMVELGHQHNIPVIYDLGSGAMVRLSDYGIQDEPNVLDSVKSGADIISFSGDKLLGGPQAGIIIGRREYIEAMKKNPLTRAFRIDKLTPCRTGSYPAGISGPSRGHPPQPHPADDHRHHGRPGADGSAAAGSASKGLRRQLPRHPDRRFRTGRRRLGANPDDSQLGGRCRTDPHLFGFAGNPPARKTTRLPVIARISKDRLLLDVRTIESRHFDYVAQSILDCCSK